MSSTIEDEGLIIKLINLLIIDFSRGRQPVKRPCIASINQCTIKPS
jgi:hypothetical protein